MTGAGDPMRWAAVGTGTISRSVVPDMGLCDGVEVAVVQSRDADKAARFADEFGIPASTGSYDDVLADPSIDAVYIATPFAVHHRMTRQALMAGKHVLVEKPMGMNAAEVEDLFALAGHQGVFCMEAMWMKFSPIFRRLQEELAQGRIGEVRNVRATFGVPFPDEGGSKWDPARSGGALLDQGIYPVTLAHSVLGPPASVHAGGVVREDGLDVAEHFTFEYDGGRFMQGASSLAEFGELTASVAGTRGWITLDVPFWAATRMRIHAGGMQEIFRTPQEVEIPWEGHGYVPMIRAVAQAIDAGQLQHPIHNADDTVAVFRTIDEIFAQIRRVRT